MNNFKKRLKELLAERHITQNKLAEMIGITQSTVSKWFVLDGHNSPTMNQLIEISRLLQVDLNWLFLGVGDKNMVNFYQVDEAKQIDQVQTELDFVMKEVKLLKELNDCKSELIRLQNELSECKKNNN
jgi:transcriptional regulator with XRE-family HTH domain